MSERKRKRHKGSDNGGLQAVAEAAGVSTATVSRTLNGHRYVKEDLRRRVIAAAERLNYQPNAAARDLARGSSSLVLVDFGGPLRFELGRLALLRLVAGEVLAHGGYPVLSGGFHHGEQPREAALLASVRSALILGQSPELRQALRERGVPFVHLDAPSGPDDHAIQIDRAEGCAAAARHLIERGHRALGYAGLEDSVKYQGFAAAAREAGVPCRAVGTGGLPAFLAEHPEAKRTTGWLLASEATLVPSLEHFARAGVRFGRDAAAVCYGDTGLAENARPPLSTLRVPYEEMARRAVALLPDLRPAGEAEPQRIAVCPELHVRESSAFRFEPKP